MEDYYQVLGVPPHVSQEELKERFRFLAHAYHPDKFAAPTHKEHAEEAFKKINEAYQILSNPVRRAQYDRQRSSSDSRYKEERRGQEEAETARHRAEEERRRREEAETARCRAEEGHRKREDTEAESRRAKRAWYWIIGVIGAEALLLPLFPLLFSTIFRIRIINMILLIPLITLYIAYRYPIAWGWAAISVVVLHGLNHLDDFLRFSLYSDLILNFIFSIGNAVAVSIVTFLRLRRLSRVNTSQGTIPSGND